MGIIWICTNNGSATADKDFWIPAVLFIITIIIVEVLDNITENHRNKNIKK
jgi:hypothetical protein